jgi:hypothetical protein
MPNTCALCFRDLPGDHGERVAGRGLCCQDCIETRTLECAHCKCLFVLSDLLKVEDTVIGEVLALCHICAGRACLCCAGVDRHRHDDCPAAGVSVINAPAPHDYWGRMGVEEADD